MEASIEMRLLGDLSLREEQESMGRKIGITFDHYDLIPHVHGPLGVVEYDSANAQW